MMFSSPSILNTSSSFFNQQKMPPCPSVYPSCACPVVWQGHLWFKKSALRKRVSLLEMSISVSKTFHTTNQHQVKATIQHTISPSHSLSIPNRLFFINFMAVNSFQRQKTIPCAHSLFSYFFLLLLRHSNVFI